MHLRRSRFEVFNNEPAFMTQRVLTGITTTGTPHLGNYVGAIRPAIAASREPGVESFFFLADYHALIKCDQPARIERSRLEIAATWIAAGLDTERTTFYRQSDIVEIPELTWLLTCVASKGQMNRAHAYKAAADANVAAGDDVDAGITMGLFSYPILMAADILMFNAHRVPVGRDQVQHIEMARDLAQRFNHLFGNGREVFVLPQANVDERVAMLPGLDGRKMSKSYDNTIPLFSPRAQLQKLIGGIVTDSRAPGEPKETEGSALFQIFQAFADADETAALRKAYAEGIGWGDAKQLVFERIDRELTPLREHYETLMNDPAQIERTLLIGADKARELSRPFMATLRQAVGLRSLASLGGQEAAVGKTAGKGGKTGKPAFKQYRERDGQFYFKLLDGHNETLLQSRGFQSPQEAGRAIGALQHHPNEALTALTEQLEPVDNDAVQAVMAALKELAGQAS